MKKAKVLFRTIAEVDNKEKTEIHFMFNELKVGLVELARRHELKSTDVFTIVQEVEAARVEFKNREPVVYRKHYVNPRFKSIAEKEAELAAKKEAKRISVQPKKKGYNKPKSDVNSAMADAFKNAGL